QERSPARVRSVGISHIGSRRLSHLLALYGRPGGAKPPRCAALETVQGHAVVLTRDGPRCLLQSAGDPLGLGAPDEAGECYDLHGLADTFVQVAQHSRLVAVLVRAGAPSYPPIGHRMPRHFRVSTVLRSRPPTARWARIINSDLMPGHESVLMS